MSQALQQTLQRRTRVYLRCDATGEAELSGDEEISGCEEPAYDERFSDDGDLAGGEYLSGCENPEGIEDDETDETGDEISATIVPS